MSLQEIYYMSKSVESSDKSAQYLEHLEFITTALPALVCYVDKQERYQFVNPAFKEWFSVEESQIIGQTIAEAVGDESYTFLQPKIQKALAGERVSFENQLKLSTGLRYTEATYIPHEDDKGNIKGFVAVIRDVTERKRAEQTRQFLADAGVLFASTLDYEELLTTLPKLSVPALADFALLLLTNERNQVVAAKIAHAEAEKEILLAQIQIEFPQSWQNLPAVAEVLKNRQPVLVTKIDEKELQAWSLSETHYTYLKELNPNGLLVVPLASREHFFGVLLLALTPYSNRSYSQDEVELAEEVVRRAGLVLENARLYQAERRARERSDRLQAVTASLAEAFTPKEILQAVLREGMNGLGIKAGLLATLTDDGDHLEIIEHTGYPANFMDAWQKFPLSKETPLTRAVREKNPVWVETVADQNILTKYPFLKEATNLSNSKALVAIPLTLERQTVGVLGLSFNEPRYFDDDDKAFMVTLGRQCAQALERAKFYQAERESRRAAERIAEQTARLQAITRAFSEALTPEQVLQIVAQEGLKVVGALSCAVYLLDNQAEPPILELAESAGLSEEIKEGWGRFLLNDPTIGAEVVRTAQPLFINSLATLAQRYNYTERVYEVLRGHAAFAGLPMLVRGQLIGTIGFTFSQEQKFLADEQNFLQALVNACAQALERARLYKSESQARRETERGRQRLAFLAEAGRLLASSLDYEETLNSLVRLVVPSLADWCNIDVLEKDFTKLSLTRPVIAHADPAKEALVLELRQRFALQDEDDTGAIQVMRAGKPLFRPIITPEMLENEIENPEQRRLMQQVGFHSFLCVPLIAREQVLGAMTLVLAAESGKFYSLADVLLAEEIAQRAANAIDNARLYLQAREAIKMRDEFLSVAAHELKTPITSLKGYSQLVIRQLNRQGELDTQRVARALDVINVQSDKLSYLVSQLLDISRLEAGRMQLESKVTNLNDLVENIANSLRPSLSEKHQLTLRAPETVMANLDPLRIEQVVTNLLSNAIKYSPEGGPIEIEISCLDSMTTEGAISKVAQISVSDRGIGIAPEFRTQLFERFYQGHPNNVTRGMGLGLYISQQIIQLHNGTITAEFPEQGGTCFIVQIPGAI